MRDRTEPEDPLSFGVLAPLDEQRAHLEPELGISGLGNEHRALGLHRLLPLWWLQH